MIKSYQHADNFLEQEHMRYKVLRNEEWEARGRTGKTKSKDDGRQHVGRQQQERHKLSVELLRRDGFIFVLLPPLINALGKHQ